MSNALCVLFSDDLHVILFFVCWPILIRFSFCGSPNPVTPASRFPPHIQPPPLCLASISPTNHLSLPPLHPPRSLRSPPVPLFKRGGYTLRHGRVCSILDFDEDFTLLSILPSCGVGAVANEIIFSFARAPIPHDGKMQRSVKSSAKSSILQSRRPEVRIPHV